MAVAVLLMMLGDGKMRGSCDIFIIVVGYALFCEQPSTSAHQRPRLRFRFPPSPRYCPRLRISHSCLAL